MLFDHVVVLVRGGGDLATGVVYRLIKAGFPVVITELAQPLAIRRTVAFASAVFEEQVTIEDLTARRIDQAADIPIALAAGEIPVLVDEAGMCLAELKPPVVVDARIAKRNLGTSIHDAALVIALGPGFEAGNDCHAVIETNRGHYLGRVIWCGTAEPNTGQPGVVKGRVTDRVLRAPAAGYVVPDRQIGDMLQAGELIASVGGVSLTAPFDGMLRGLIHPSVQVSEGMKIGDLDPRGERDFCFKISEKSLAIGGGVIEAVLSAPQLAGLLKRGRE